MAENRKYEKASGHAECSFRWTMVRVSLIEVVKVGR